MDQQSTQRAKIDLARTIRKSRKTSAYAVADRAEFLPISELDSIINHDNIQSHQAAICPGITEAELHSLSRNVRNDNEEVDWRRIFAILALIKKTESISDFIAAGINDSHLPLHFSWKSGEYEVVRPGDGTHITLFDTWSELECEFFKSNQRCMLAPVFEPTKNRIKVQTIGQHSVLPFLEYEKMGEGGYGNVFKVRIHPSHHTFSHSAYSEDENPYFAVKTLRLKGRKEFDQEVEALTKVSCVARPNPHLIKLLMAYEIGDTYHLLFNCADGNLRQYWESNNSQPQTLERAHWFIEQCAGLAWGLRKIHRVRTSLWNKDGKQLPAGVEREKNRGRHGDLKPENILYFQKDGKVQLVISDFGFSRYHSPESQSNDLLAGWTGAYRPPECDMKHSITQRYDIWTLGCVFLIFISWFVLDYETGVEIFANKRAEDDVHVQGQLYNEDKFFKIEDGKPRIKTSVKNWISKIRATKTCPTFVKDFLDLIEEGLLLILSGDRWNSDRILTRLTEIKNECHKNAAYCIVQEADAPQETFDIPTMIIEEGIHIDDRRCQPQSKPPPNSTENLISENETSRYSGQLKKARFEVGEPSQRLIDEGDWKYSTGRGRIDSSSQQERAKSIPQTRFLQQDVLPSSGKSDEDGATNDTALTTPLTSSDINQVQACFSDKLSQHKNHTFGKGVGPYHSFTGNGMIRNTNNAEHSDLGDKKVPNTVSW